MTELKIRKIGNSLGVILPKDILDQLFVSEGDILLISNDRGVATFSTPDPDFSKKMNIAMNLMDRYRDTLSELSK